MQEDSELKNIRFEYKYVSKYQGILTFLSSHNGKRSELLEYIGISDNFYNKVKYINTLLDYGLIEMTKINLQNPNQSYKITDKGLRYLNMLKEESLFDTD